MCINAWKRPKDSTPGRHMEIFSSFVPVQSSLPIRNGSGAQNFLLILYASAENEATCEHNALSVMHAIDTASEAQKIDGKLGFAAMKVSPIRVLVFAYQIDSTPSPTGRKWHVLIRICT